MTSQQRLIVALSIIFAGLALSTAATNALIVEVYGIPCSQSFLTSKCAFGPDQALGPDAFGALGLFLIAVLGIAHFRFRSAVAYPFLMLIGGLCLAALALDTALGNPIIHAAKVINDTLNILGAVIAASFVLLLVILRNQPYSLPALLWAVILSFAIKTLSVTAFVELRGAVFGITELLLLYIVYAFGAFTLHLMTVSSFVADITPRLAKARS